MAQNNTEVEKVAINDIGTVDDFIKAVDSTIKNFSDGDLVEGTVVKVCLLYTSDAADEQ